MNDKKKYFYTLFLVFATLSFLTEIQAQISSEDYVRADSVMNLADLVYNQVGSVNWIDSTSVFWYDIKTRNGMEYNIVDAEKRNKKSAFDTEKLVDALNKQLDKKISKESLRLRDLKPGDDGGSLHFTYENAFWTVNIQDYSLRKDSVMKDREPQSYWGNQSDELGNDPVVSPDNVDPASTMQVADALIEAKKDFELVVLPGMNHTLGGTYGEQKRRDFFIRNLLNEQTPDWNSVSN